MVSINGYSCGARLLETNVSHNVATDNRVRRSEHDVFTTNFGGQITTRLL